MLHGALISPGEARMRPRPLKDNNEPLLFLSSNIIINFFLRFRPNYMAVTRVDQTAYTRQIYMGTQD